LATVRWGWRSPGRGDGFDLEQPWALQGLDDHDRERGTRITQNFLPNAAIDAGLVAAGEAGGHLDQAGDGQVGAGENREDVGPHDPTLPLEIGRNRAVLPLGDLTGDEEEPRPGGHLEAVRIAAPGRGDCRRVVSNELHAPLRSPPP
jgi:hypothetical protein